MGCLVTLISDNGLKFTSRPSYAFYERVGINKINTTSYHPRTNGGVERVNHTMAIMLSMGVNVMQDNRDALLKHIESAYNNSVNAPTGLAPNEVRMGRLLRLPLSVFDPPNIGGHQRLDRGHLAYCDLATERQQSAYRLVRELHTINAPRLARRNSPVTCNTLRPGNILKSRRPSVAGLNAVS